MTARAPGAATLHRRYVLVSPTQHSDAPALFAALDEASVWQWLTEPRPAGVGEMQRLVDRAIGDPGRFPWTVRRYDGTVVGWTSYADIQPAHERIEIGSTAYSVPWQRTAVNTETKLLLLGHAFDDLGYGRVTLKTDACNERSQRAIERLGAVREGVLRRHLRRPDGNFRDTVYYALLRAEWPAVRARLEARLG